MFFVIIYYVSLVDVIILTFDFYRFPKDNRRGVWMQAFGLTEVSDWHRVCSRHFDPEHFTSGGHRKMLLRNAVPLTTEK